jgi:hypothetical protein
LSGLDGGRFSRKDAYPRGKFPRLLIGGRTAGNYLSESRGRQNPRGKRGSGKCFDRH